jgi:hypothetical protein
MVVVELYIAMHRAGMDLPSGICLLQDITENSGERIDPIF